MFSDGQDLDEIIASKKNAIWVTSRVRIVGTHLYLDDFTFYPASGAAEDIGVEEVLLMMRLLLNQAFAEGLTAYTLTAERMYRGKPRRMISMTRRLR